MPRDWKKIARPARTRTVVVPPPSAKDLLRANRRLPLLPERPPHGVGKRRYKQAKRAEIRAAVRALERVQIGAVGLPHEAYLSFKTALDTMRAVQRRCSRATWGR